MNIPLVNLKRQYLSIKPEIDSAIQGVINDSAFILGKYTQRFEQEYASYCGVKHCIGLNSGTDALFLSFLAIGLKRGDEVITVSNTFFATTEYLGHLGVKPVFVDIDEKTCLIDVSKIEPLITNRTRAIIPVHLYGQMADMDEICRLAGKYNLKVIEDCAQAHGSEQNTRKAGGFGDIGIYSFYPGKNLGAYGDAGCVVTNNDEYEEFFRLYRDHGRKTKYEHVKEAYSSRMDGLQAAVLSVKLKHLDHWVEQRRQIAGLYNDFLPKSLRKPFEKKGNKYSYHIYAIETERRDDLLKYLKSKGIEAGIHYPIPLHLQPAYDYLGKQKQSLSVSENHARTTISLPIFPEMTKEEVEYVAESVKDFFRED
ncbi:TPA: hypothetical protein DEX28_00995 [Patescibacteria group bacterium]|nr:MAG: Pleiotropic regulatory protein [Candidatus Woesebacteria bacterium GW2011_GWC1_42_9]HCI05304.1 hypothetical protein [Patescibacteria group bacterium]